MPTDIPKHTIEEKDEEKERKGKKDKKEAEADQFLDKLAQRSSVLAIIVHSNPFPVLSGLAFEIRRLCDALQCEIGDEILSCNSIPRLITSSAKKFFTPGSSEIDLIDNVRIRATPYVAAVLSIVCPLDSFVNRTVLTVAGGWDHKFDISDDNRVFARSVKLVRTQWYLRLNHWRYALPSVGNLFPASFHRFIARVSHYILRPHEKLCPVPLEYPGDYVSLGKAVLSRHRKIEFKTLANHMNRMARHYEDEFSLIDKIDAFGGQFGTLVSSNASQVLMTQSQQQHQRQTQSQYIANVALGTSIVGGLQLLRKVKVQFKPHFEVDANEAKNALKSAGDKLCKVVVVVYRILRR